MKKKNRKEKKKTKPDTKVEVTGGEIEVREESGYYEAYKGFSTSLRVWFIAYGVGAPVALLSKENSWDAVVKSGQGTILAVLFFLGVGIQILATLIYKASMWYLYMAELGNIKTASKRYKCSNFFASYYVVESLFDITTFILFGWASIIIMQLVMRSL